MDPDSTLPAVSPLDEIQTTFGLSASELASLFNVSRAAISRWIGHGVPISRLADVVAVAQAARALRSLFRSEIIPQIVTEPIPGLGGRTILDVAKDEPGRIVELVAETRSFLPQAPTNVGRVDASGLDEIRSTFGLSETALAALFRVSRSSLTHWRKDGIPIDRGADVDRIRELAGYLHRRFLPARIPDIVRTPAHGLDDKTVLDILRERDVDRVYAYLEGLFSYIPRG